MDIKNYGVNDLMKLLLSVHIMRNLTKELLLVIKIGQFLNSYGMGSDTFIFHCIGELKKIKKYL